MPGDEPSVPPNGHEPAAQRAIQEEIDKIVAQSKLEKQLEASIAKLKKAQGDAFSASSFSSAPPKPVNPHVVLPIAPGDKATAAHAIIHTLLTDPAERLLAIEAARNNLNLYRTAGDIVVDIEKTIAPFRKANKKPVPVPPHTLQTDCPKCGTRCEFDYDVDNLKYTIAGETMTMTEIIKIVQSYKMMMGSLAATKPSPIPRPGDAWKLNKPAKVITTNTSTPYIDDKAIPF